MEGKADDERKRRNRELLSCCAAALPDLIDEVVLSRRNALLPNLFEALKAKCFSAMAASSASTAVTSLTEATPSTLRSEPTERPSDGQLARQGQTTALPGWGFVATTESDRHNATPNRLLWTNYHQHSCSSPPTSHEEFCEAWYGLILSIQTWKRGLFFMPSYVASEWADGTGWSRAQRLLRWQRRERYASRLPTQPNRELYGIRRAVYPDRLCRLVRMSSSGTPLTENHYADKGRQRPASEIESRLHNERLSDSKLLLGVAEATACVMLEIIDELLEKTWDAIEGPPELRRHAIKMTSEASAMPEQLVGVSKSKQEIEPFESESSLQLTENGGHKCAARCPSPKPLSDYKPTSKTFAKKELNCELHSEHDFCLTGTHSLINEKKTLEETSAGKSACNRTWLRLPPPRVTEADNHALHRSLRIGEQNMYYANPAKREVTNFHQEVEDNDLLRGSIPLTSLKCCSPVTELGERAKTSGIIERSQQDVSIAAYNNEFFQNRAPPKAIAVNENAEVAIAGNAKLKLVQLSSKQKHEPSVKCTYLEGTTVQSPEKKASDNIQAASQEQRSPIEESSAQNYLTLPVREKAPKNDELSKEECVLNEESSADIDPSNSIESSMEIQASGNKTAAAATRKEPTPNEMSARRNPPYVAQMAVENESNSETGNTSNYSIAAGSIKARMTLAFATTVWGQSFPVHLSELGQAVYNDGTELIQKAHAAGCLDVGRWQKVMRMNQKSIGDDATKSERVVMESRLWTELIVSRIKPERQENDWLSNSVVTKPWPYSTSPPDQREPGEARVCHKQRERKQETEKSTVGGTLPVHVLDIPAVTRKLPTAPEKCRDNSQDTSQDAWEREGWVDFGNDTLEGHFGKSCKRHEANNWKWGIGGQESEPRVSPTLFPSSSSGSASWELVGQRRSVYQAQASNSPRDVDLWKSDHRSSPPWAPHSEGYVTANKSYGRQDHFSQPCSNGTSWKTEPSEQASLKCQSPFSYSDWRSFFGLEKRTANDSSEPAAKYRHQNCFYPPSGARNSPPQFQYTCQKCPACGSNEARVPLSESETKNMPYDTLDRRQAPWENLPVSRHSTTGRTALKSTGSLDYFCERVTYTTLSSFDWQQEAEESLPLPQRRHLALWERTGTPVDSSHRRSSYKL